AVAEPGVVEHLSRGGEEHRAYALRTARLERSLYQSTQRGGAELQHLALEIGATELGAVGEATEREDAGDERIVDEARRREVEHGVNQIILHEERRREDRRRHPREEVFGPAVPEPAGVRDHDLDP